MGLAALALFVPQLVFVPLMQHGTNRRTEARVRLLRRIGAGVIARNLQTEPLTSQVAGRIDRESGSNYLPMPRSPQLRLPGMFDLHQRLGRNTMLFIQTMSEIFMGVAP